MTDEAGCGWGYRADRRPRAVQTLIPPDRLSPNLTVKPCTWGVGGGREATGGMAHISVTDATSVFRIPATEIDIFA